MSFALKAEDSLRLFSPLSGFRAQFLLCEPKHEITKMNPGYFLTPGSGRSHDE